MSWQTALLCSTCFSLGACLGLVAGALCAIDKIRSDATTEDDHVWHDGS
jgi:hypothetical protein